VKRLLLTVAALAAIGTAPSARAQTIPAGPGTELSSLVGQSLDVPFVVDMSARAELLGAFAMRISWNPAVLRFDAGLPGSFGGVTANTDSAAQGIVRLAGANPSGVGGAVTIGVARFTPLLAETATVHVAMLELFAAGSFADMLPAVVASNGLFCPALGRYGDVDRDADADSRDALVALSNAVGLDVSAFDVALGDVDDDGNTNARDALIILSAAVGLDVSGYRVLTLAGGACAAGQPVSLAIVPGALGDVVVGQTVHFEARSVDGNGVPQALTDVRWITMDPAVLGILSTGLAVAREAGTTDVLAVRDGRDTATVTVQVVARRTTHHVSAAAVNVSTRLGTSTLPFASLDELGQVVQQGDTVRLRPGRYPGGASVDRGVVLIGERSGADGVVIGGRGEPVGLSVSGTGVLEIHDLAIEGFQTGLSIGNADTVLIDSLQVMANGGQSACYETGVGVGSAWLVRIRWSRVIGDGTGGCANGVRLLGSVGIAVIEDVTLTDLGSTGIDATNVDSLVVRRTLISDVGGSGVSSYTYAGGGGGGDAPPADNRGPMRGPTQPPASVAVVIEDSRIVRPDWSVVEFGEVRSVLITRSVLDGRPYADGPYVYGVYGAGGGTGVLRLVRDSIITDDYDWLDAGDLDSVIIDSTRVVGAYGGYIDNVSALRVTNSSFHEMQYGTTFSIDGWPNRTTVLFDSVSIAGAAACEQCLYAVNGYSMGGTFNRLRVHNADEGIYAGDSAITVTNSAFTNTYEPIYLYSEYLAPQRMTVRNVTLSGTQYGVEVDDAVAVVESVAVTGTWYAIETWGAGRDTIRDNTILDGHRPIQAYDASAHISGNVITNVQDVGIEVAGYQLAPADSTVISDNQLTCAPQSYAWAAIQVSETSARIQQNTMSGGCEYGIKLEPTTPRGALIRGNTVTLDALTVHTGIRVDAGWRARVVGNLVTGGRDEGTIRVGGSGDASRTSWVLVDSNTVQNAVAWGIRAAWLDTLEIRGNLVEDVTNPCCFSPNLGAIAVSQVRTRARVAGNTVRRSAAPGIAAEQQEYYWYPLDTATIVVDSNAVSAVDTVAVRVGTATVSLRHNNIRNNTGDGVRFDASTSGNLLRDNAFQGTGRYAVYIGSEASVSADSNWWGVNGQPPRQPGDTVIAGVDSVSGVFDSAPLAAEPFGLLPLAPPAFRLSPVLASVGAAAPTGAAVPPRVERSRTVRPDRPERVREEPRRPLPGARGQAQTARAAFQVAREQRLAEHREAAVAAKAARDGERDARRAAQERRAEDRR
jgi:hypothetical protein